MIRFNGERVVLVEIREGSGNVFLKRISHVTGFGCEPWIVQIGGHLKSLPGKEGL